VVVFPAFAATVADIAAEIDALEYEYGFVPDVVVVDYADILAVENRNLSERGNIDAIWKRLKGMAAERHMLVVTASQSNRGSIKKRTVDQTDTAEDIRKIAHVDVMISLNQQPDERDRGVMRLCVIAHRHREFSQNRQVQVLQQLGLGQPFLDSEWVVENL
jgi:replicative DNA helicase